jgi:opacity protein-like surface antigen
VDSTGVTTFNSNAGPFTGNITCNQTTRNDFTGFQFGGDIARLNFGGGGYNLHIGVTGGVGKIDSQQEPGSFRSRIEVPFIGGYVAVTGGGFFADVQVRGDFYNISLSDPLAGLNNTPLDARAISVNGSVGYQFQLGNNWFVEPSAAFLYSRMKVDPLAVNAPILVFPFPFPFAGPATAQISDIETKLGRIGVRLGTNVLLGGVAVQPFVSGSVWHDFARNVNTTLTVPPGSFLDLLAPGLTANVSTSRVTTFGQVSVGAAYSVLDTGWVGYTRFDYRKGDDIEGIAFNTGLRYMFNADRPVAAASGKSPMYTKAPVVAVAPFTWTGFYVGGFVGGARAAGDVTATEIAPGPGFFGAYNFLGSTVTYGLGSSVIAGSTVGWNQQFGWLVAGLEGEVGFMRLRGTGGLPNPPLLIDTFSATRTADWYGVIAGRLGVAFDHALFYAKGGAAFVGISSSVTDFCITAPCGGAFVGANGGSSIRPTWTAGGGLEYAFTNNWTVKAEYLYLATEQSYVASGPANTVVGFPPQNFNWNHDVPGIHTGKVGINYKFDVAAAPISAKY